MADQTTMSEALATNLEAHAPGMTGPLPTTPAREMTLEEEIARDEAEADALERELAPLATGVRGPSSQAESFYAARRVALLKEAAAIGLVHRGLIGELATAGAELTDAQRVDAYRINRSLAELDRLFLARLSR